MNRRLGIRAHLNQKGEVGMCGDDGNSRYPDVEQRREPRFPTFFFVNLMHENGEHFMEATVRDYSKNGAQIRIKSTDDVPQRLIIRSSSDCSQRIAVVRWLNGASIGLEMDPHPVLTAVDS